jgi:signal peptidase II
MRTTLITALAVFLADQLSKFIVLYLLDLDEIGEIEVISPFFQLQMAWNKGINFGLFAGFDMRWVLIALALSISVGVIYWVHRDGKTKWTFVAAGMLVGGALGNVLDRVIYGAVADFLNFSCCGLNNPYAFNIADVAVFAGAAALVFTSSESSDTNTRTKKKN